MKRRPIILGAAVAAAMLVSMSRHAEADDLKLGAALVTTRPSSLLTAGAVRPGAPKVRP